MSRPRRGRGFRPRVVAPFRQAGCVTLTTNGRLCCTPGPAVPHERCEIMGPTAPQPFGYWESVARRGLGYDWPEAERVAIAAHMARWGECLWHAVSVIRNRADRCPCAACQPKDPRYPWRLLDLELAGYPVTARAS